MLIVDFYPSLAFASRAILLGVRLRDFHVKQINKEFEAGVRERTSWEGGGESPLHRLGGLEEYCKLPQWGLDRSPDRTANAFWTH